MNPIWCVMPVLAGPEMTEAAIADCLAQSVPTRLLIINQGVDTAFRERLERLSEQYADRIFLWSHEPTLLSLAASWNRALDFVWESDGECALVVNNDVRLHPQTVELLDGVLGHTDALFVSAVGVTAEQFDPNAPIEGRWFTPPKENGLGDVIHKGGPDFSCFLISRACHTGYRFDESFIPAYCEDLDYHRRLMLAGDGPRIFSVNLPYLHLAAQTLQQVDPQKRMAIERQIGQGSRAYYQKKWGGPVNEETFFSPFDQGVEGISTAGMPNPPTTPALQQWVHSSTAEGVTP